VSDNPYREEGGGGEPEGSASARESANDSAPPAAPEPQTYSTPEAAESSPGDSSAAPQQGGMDQQGNQGGGFQRNNNNGNNNFQQQGQRPDRRNGRRHRRGRGRGRGDQPNQQGGGGQYQNQNQNYNQGGGQSQQQFQQQPPQPIVVTSEVRGWFEPSRDGGYIRRAGSSYLADQGDAWVPPHLFRQYGLRRSDLIVAGVGIDQRGRPVVAEIREINDKPAGELGIRPEFNSLIASYPERKIFLETGKPAKGGHEVTRRAIDLIAPIGYGQRALIVAPARAGKTTLMHAITEGISINHPKAHLLILLVDERPEEVSEAISWGVGEVISSSFDQPAQRHVEVTEMTLARAHRLVEMGNDVIIVLDSLTRMARAHNTAERGSGRTMSGGLDATAMAKPKAFFGSARNIPDTSGGGSLTIIATALVETGSRMDDVIFEEFKGTGNCEIKLDRSLAEKRIYPAIDIGTSGTRREEKLFRPDQLDAVFTLRRGLSQMPPQSAMEWLIKRIAATPSNDQLLSGL
jgi:transcription termination factor Rho